jgi:L-lactate dehydrogenase complex protein LldF
MSESTVPSQPEAAAAGNAPPSWAGSAADFKSASRQAAGNERLKRAVTLNTLRQYTGRQQRMNDLPDAEALKDLAGRIRQHALDNLDYYLDQLSRSVVRNGGHVHFAATAADARDIVLRIARETGCQRIIKSKSMVTEEIDLPGAMEKAGLDVVETDLGEFIVQISHDRPSHLVAPIIHKDVESISRLFSDYFQVSCGTDPGELTALARKHLREKFRRADMGMTGGNFVVAETGQLCVVENEGNARQSITTPRVLVSVTGIEKVVPRLTDLAVLLKLLARSSTGQAMTIYTNIFGGPRKPGEKDGPEEFHLVLVDNGRSDILARPEYRPTLRCIRCGACLNACPVYRKIGGHAYGSVYSGPIGALLTPLLWGLKGHQDLPQASSLCGACGEACPVKIDIPRYLVSLRRDMVRGKMTGRVERMTYRLWAWSMRRPRVYALSIRLQNWELRRRARGGKWISRLPMAAKGWTEVRDLPAPAKVSFHQVWSRRPLEKKT